MAQDQNKETRLTVSGIESAVFEKFAIEVDQPTEDIAGQLLHGLEQDGFLLATVRVVADKHIHADLGTISLITVIGLDRNVEKKVRAYLAKATLAPRLAEIDRALALINDLPGVSATLALEKMEGESGFEAVVVGQESWQFGAVSFDSTPRNLFAQNRINLQQDFYGVATGGDIVRLQGVFIDGDGKPAQHSIFGSYQFPLGNQGTYAEAGAGDIQTETTVRGESTAAVTDTGFSIRSGAVTNHDFEGQIASLTLGHPLVRTHDRATYLIGNVDFNADKTETVGEVDTFTGNLSVLHSHQSATGASFAAGITLGIGTTDSYIDEDDGEFYHLQFGSGYIRPLHLISPETEIRLEGFGQISTKDTPNSKTIGLGGTDFLRGYASSTFAGNSGFVGTAEVAHAFTFARKYARRFVPYAFVDLGLVANPGNKQNTSSRPVDDQLVSVGLGSKVDVAPNVSLDGYVGVPLMRDQTGKTPGAAGYMKLTLNW